MGRVSASVIQGLHHLGMIVRDARATAARLRQVGLDVAAWEDYGPGLLRIAFIPVGDVLLELIEPLTDDGFNADWLRERGEGLQHVAFRVGDLEAAMAALRARGVALQDETPRPGAGRTRIAFLAAGTVEGLLIELTQPLEDA